MNRRARLLLVAAVLSSANSRSLSSEVDAFQELQNSGIEFVHTHGGCGRYYFPEIMGAGGALLDYDGDGDLDVYLVQGERLCRDIEVAQDQLPALSDRLYRNEGSLGVGGGHLRFADVTRKARIPAGGYGMGATVGDYDRDGWPDLYITNLQSNRLLRNRGDGTFEDVTASSGTDDRRWSVSATFFDYDNDDWLDLYVGNYVDYSITKQVPCVGNTGAVDYCAPAVYPHLPDRLFRNLANGSFEDITGSAGLSGAKGAALGVAAADFDQDGRVDLYVTNDGIPNFMWMNRGDGSFEDEALLRGCAVNAHGQPEASMGVDLADFDGDADDDIIVTHLGRESNTLYENDGTGMFLDRSTATGLATPSWKMTGFGTSWSDYDNDSWLDLIVVNGAAHYVESLRQARDPYPFHEPNQLYRNLGNGRFADVTEKAGPSFMRSEVSRGALSGDLDNDGDADLIVVNNNGPARILLNQIGQSRAWIGADLLAGEPSRQALGARLGVVSGDGAARWSRVRTTAGYASAGDGRILVGLDEHRGKVTLLADWKNPGFQAWKGLPIGRYFRLIRPTRKVPQ